MSARISSLLPLLLLWLASPACQACSVCFSANEAARKSYIYTTAFLTLMPLLLVGGFLLWLRREQKARKLVHTESGTFRAQTGG